MVLNKTNIFFVQGTGPDGVTRGTFSYLDDKGVQRTTQYIAGAGIGYRIVQDTTGVGTHLLPRNVVNEFGILYPRNQQGDRGANGPDPDDDAGNDSIGNRNNGNNGSPGGNGNGGDGGGIGGDGIPNVDDNSIDLDGPFGDFDDTNRKGGRPGGDRSNPDFPINGRDGGPTIIHNTGDTILFRSGILPGATARAHVQNIDLKPYGDDGAISPSEALRRDERKSLQHRFRG